MRWRLWLVSGVLLAVTAIAVTWFVTSPDRFAAADAKDVAAGIEDAERGKLVFAADEYVFYPVELDGRLGDRRAPAASTRLLGKAAYRLDEVRRNY